jgi:hypothetical protein
MKVRISAMIVGAAMMLAGCDGSSGVGSLNGPFEPGTYGGTVAISMTVYEDGTSTPTTQNTSFGSSELINDDGMLCDMTGQPICEGMVLTQTLGGSSSKQTIHAVIVSDTGITVTMSGRLTIVSPSLGTLEGTIQRTMRYTWIDSRTIQFDVTATEADDTGKYTATLTGSGVLQR